MRFALIATSAAAAVAVPLALAAAGPQMSRDQFLSAVRCTAFEDVSTGGRALGEAKWRLNAEARRQPADAAAEARAEVSAIARQALAGADLAPMCADGQLAGSAAGRASV